MLDKSIPHIGVIMIKSDTKEYPKHELPEGYTFSTYEKGDEKHWSDLKVSVGEFNTGSDACKYFEAEFMRNLEDLKTRCVFVKNQTGEIVATSSLWHGNHFGTEMQRIHWVSVHPEHQGRGIAKALLTRVLDIFNEQEFDGSIYLTTQTWSYIAIKIYLNFGFKPFMGIKPKNWNCIGDDFDRENFDAWQLIYEKLKK